MDQPRVVQKYLGDGGTALLLTTDHLHLFKSSFTPTPSSVIADFIANEVVFTGYAEKTINLGWGSGLDDVGHYFFFNAGLFIFIQTGTTDTDVVGGWWIDDGAGPGTVLKLVGTLDSPFPFDTAGNKLVLKLNGGADWVSGQDAEVVFGP